jgi:hypothetical protein
MKMFIDAHRNEYGVEPICGVLPIAPSTYRAHAARLADPSLMSERAKRDASLRPESPSETFSSDFIVLQSSAGEEEGEGRCLRIGRGR